MADQKNNKIQTGRKKIERTFIGSVVSDKMDKTIIVKVDRTKLHKRYLKRYTVSKRYKVHDEKNLCKVGDKVKFTECRPISKDKRWRLIK
ncbi:MAG: 30S ribosomal protein S17 [Patescibacteria group bacterium]